MAHGQLVWFVRDVASAEVKFAKSESHEKKQKSDKEDIDAFVVVLTRSICAYATRIVAYSLLISIRVLCIGSPLQSSGCANVVHLRIRNDDSDRTDDHSNIAVHRTQGVNVFRDCCGRGR